jgi:4-amino-4-deoxy-L-arabinose transferase-like glycosyltransferase
VRPDSLSRRPSGDGPGSGAAGGAPAAGPRNLLKFIVAALLAVRLVGMGFYPLMDTSEARYGEIARIMLVTGNWVTPQETPGVPFWAKPPLSTWLSAGSQALFGTNEFALRLPAWLCAVGVLWLCFSWSTSLRPRTGAPPGRGAWLMAALLCTSAGFYAAAGTVMTDPSLALCTTAMLVAFHHAVLKGSRAPAWRYGFFVAAGLGMLAKGPVILLYAGAPIGLWALWERRLVATWRGLPWVGGTLLAAAVCLPWYALAELRTPGFLQYFLLGEHVMRFLQPGWGGDRYGTAHAEPLGTIWLHLAWTMGLNVLLGLALLVSAGRGGVAAARRSLDAERKLLLLAALVPVFFFTFAGNIIWTYVLPSLGPLAVLLADALAPRMAAQPAWRRATLGVLGAGGMLLVLLIVFYVPRHVSSHSSASLLPAWQSRAHPGGDRLIYIGRRIPASLRFYSRGEAVAEADSRVAVAQLAPGADRYLAVAPADAAAVRQAVAQAQPGAGIVQVGENKDLVLLQVSAAPPASPPPPAPPSPRTPPPGADSRTGSPASR